MRFEVDPAHEVDETISPGEEPAAAAERLAREKAMACLAARPDADAVIAADTLVVLGGRILGKPRDAADAAAMLRALAGREHQVVTGWTVQTRARVLAGAVRTSVRFRELTGAEIAAYVATGEPLDKAGGYGIQGVGSLLVEAIAGDYFTVVGLPLARVGAALASLGMGPLPHAEKNL